MVGDEPGECWAGVDVGARRKGFHVAVIDEGSLLEVTSGLGLDRALGVLSDHRPSVVAIDSPRQAAPDGERSRCGERKLSRVCGIRYTPDRATIDSHPGGYYDWIRCGFTLYERLDREAGQGQPEVIECFPTASWTRWQGPRAGTRAAWTRAGLAALELDELPRRTNQDARDAIAAAVTARVHDHGRTERYGDIVVPCAGKG